MIVTLMAATFLHERITVPRWAFVIAGFVGMLLIVRPGGEMLTPASLLALASAALYATFQILTRKLAGWLIFATFPDAWTLAGIVIIAGSGVVLTWYERWRASLPPAEPTAVD